MSTCEDIHGTILVITTSGEVSNLSSMQVFYWFISLNPSQIVRLGTKFFMMSHSISITDLSKFPILTLLIYRNLFTESDINKLNYQFQL